jgi:hypothetical protein
MCPKGHRSHDVVWVPVKKDLWVPVGPSFTSGRHLPLDRSVPDRTRGTLDECPALDHEHRLREEVDVRANAVLGGGT